MSLKRVEMSLSDRDISNVEKVKKAFKAETNAGAVSSALSISAGLVDLIDEYVEGLYVRGKDGFSRRVTIRRQE